MSIFSPPAVWDALSVKQATPQVQSLAFILFYFTCVVSSLTVPPVGYLQALLTAPAGNCNPPNATPCSSGWAVFSMRKPGHGVWRALLSKTKEWLPTSARMTPFPVLNPCFEHQTLMARHQACDSAACFLRTQFAVVLINLMLLNRPISRMPLLLLAWQLSAGAAAGAALGMVCIYITWAANGRSYEDSTVKASGTPAAAACCTGGPAPPCC
jgi:hypothetical protein